MFCSLEQRQLRAGLVEWPNPGSQLEDQRRAVFISSMCRVASEGVCPGFLWDGFRFHAQLLQPQKHKSSKAVFLFQALDLHANERQKTAALDVQVAEMGYDDLNRGLNQAAPG